jgi:hypothetical protein
MATQGYGPQGSGAPPPTLAGKFAPAQGYPEIIAITAIPGMTAQSQIGPPEVKFRLVDGRAWYVPPAVADEIYRLRIAPNQQFEVVKFGRMKHELRITPIQPRLNGNGAALTTPQPAATRSQQQHTTYPTPNRTPDAGPLPAWDEQNEQPAPAKTAPALTQSGRMMACFLAAIDAIAGAQTYADRRGLKVTFGPENVTSAALSCYINECKGGR